MAFLVDSCILIRQFDLGSPLRTVAISCLEALLKEQAEIVIFPQIIVEFWSVVTRPLNVNGLGWSPSQADAAVRGIPSAIKLLPETQAIFTEWLSLVLKMGVSGKNVHDARLVAAMNVYGINRVLTFNEADFRRYQNIVVVRPS